MRDTLFHFLKIRTAKELKSLADATGISIAELTYYDKEGIIPSNWQIQQLAQYKGVSLYEFMLHMGYFTEDLLHSISANSHIIANLLGQSTRKNSDKKLSAAKKVFSTKLGQLYEGDCLSVLSELPNSSVDLIFADPPFNLAKDYPSGINDSLKEEDYITWCKAWLEECTRALKWGGSLFLWNLPKWHMVLADFLEDRLTFRNWIGVDMKYSLPIAGRLYPSHYSLLYYVKGEKPNAFHPDKLPMQTCRTCFHEIKDYGGYKNKMNPQGINLSDIWLDIPPVRHAKYKKRSSANELSVKLLDRIIEMSSNPGDLIFDPFGGSGTTYIVSELKGRRWVGVDIGDTQCIVERFAKISDDAENLRNIRSNLNTLFTSEVERQREKLGIWTCKTFSEKEKAPEGARLIDESSGHASALNK